MIIKTILNNKSMIQVSIIVINQTPHKINITASSDRYTPEQQYQYKEYTHNNDMSEKTGKEKN